VLKRVALSKVASGYEDADITIAQTVGGATSTAMGLSITDSAGVFLLRELHLLVRM
jgi:hypothetical protein